MSMQDQVRTKLGNRKWWAPSYGHSIGDLVGVGFRGLGKGSIWQHRGSTGIHPTWGRDNAGWPSPSPFCARTRQPGNYGLDSSQLGVGPIAEGGMGVGEVTTGSRPAAISKILLNWAANYSVHTYDIISDLP
jgi:hypothetical protein